MHSTRILIALTLAATTPLGGCFLMGGESFRPEAGFAHATSAQRAPQTVQILQEVPGSAYRVLGEVTASRRMFNLFSPAPSAHDVNKALQEEAARIGADAVMNVRYETIRTGLSPTGKMVGRGLAIAFTPAQ